MTNVKNIKSIPEERLLGFLQSLVDTCEYEPADIKLEIPVTYTPDFYLGNGVWIELKSIARVDDTQKLLTFSRLACNNNTIKTVDGLVYPIEQFIVVVWVTENVLSGYHTWKNCKITRHGSVLREKQLVSWCRRNNIQVAVVCEGNYSQLEKKLKRRKHHDSKNTKRF